MTEFTQDKVPNLVIYGHVGFDISVTPTNNVKLPGGSAYYATLAASLLSSSIGIVTVIGQDFPIKNLQFFNLVDTTGINFQNGNSAVFYQEYDGENNVLSFHSHLNVCEDLSPSMIPTHYLQSKVFFVTTAPPIQQKQILDWLIIKKYAGVIAVDTTMSYVDEFRSLLKEYDKHIHIVFANASEYQALSWFPVPHITVVVKRGAKGVALWENGVWQSMPATAVSQVHTTTGAGDILAGASLAYMADGKMFKTALSTGIELATESVTNPNVEHLWQKRRLIG